jgi:2-C-methyl-D-erythritol 4-phosphate cytidylyltransferase
VGNGIITDHLNRNNFCTVQTPQGFDFSVLFKAHQKAKTLKEEFFDDAQVYSLSGKPVVIVDGDVSNKKITFQSDLKEFI